MFSTNRYITRGVQSEIPAGLQFFMWNCISAVPSPDYLQIFRLEADKGKQKIVHEQEVPEFRREYLLPSDNPINAKVYIIDDNDHSTMLLAEEY